MATSPYRIRGSTRVGEFHEAVDLLLEIGLLVTDEAADQYLPVDPATVQNRVVVPLSREGADLLSESANWAETFAELGQTYRRATRSDVGAIAELRGIPQIDNFLSAADHRRPQGASHRPALRTTSGGRSWRRP